jgi:hypothetical protein
MATFQKIIRLVSSGVKGGASAFGVGAFGNTPFGH